jgi:hypothetical protein
MALVHDRNPVRITVLICECEIDDVLTRVERSGSVFYSG